MNYETITVETKKEAGVITLNRPASMNAVCAAMLYELADAVRTFDEDKSVRVIVLKGGKDFFAAGTDMSEFASEQEEDVLSESGLYERSARAIAGCSKPVIAGVCGYVFGGGLELVLMSDIVIAADNARFGFPEITLGVLPQMGGVSLLTERVGRAKAADILLTGRHISAEEALTDGIVSRIVDSDDLDNELEETAKRIASMPAAGVRLVKQTILNSCQAKPENEKTVARLSLLSQDAREGLTALKENRAPKFKKR